MTEWKALPGGVLAYGDTGFEIREMPEAASYDAIQAFDPQGRKMEGQSYIGLAYLKRRVMEAAACADEFRGGPPVPPQSPWPGNRGPDPTPSPTPSPTLEKTR